MGGLLHNQRTAENVGSILFGTAKTYKERLKTVKKARETRKLHRAAAIIIFLMNSLSVYVLPRDGVLWDCNEAQG